MTVAVDLGPKATKNKHNKVGPPLTKISGPAYDGAYKDKYGMLPDPRIDSS